MGKIVFIRKLNGFIKLDMVKVFSLTSVATLVKMVTGLITVKVVSLLIGPTGVALIGQLQNFTKITLLVSTGGIGKGITKYIAEYRDNKEETISLLSTAGGITTSISVLLGLLLLLFHNGINSVLFRDEDYSIVFLIFGITLIFYSFNSLILSVLNGFKEFKKYVIVNIATSVVGLIFTLFLVYLYGIKGALISVVTYQSIVIIVTVFILSKTKWLRFKYFFGTISITHLKKLSPFALMAIVSASLAPLVQLLIRSYIRDQISLTDAGIWEGINRISQVYLTVFSTSLMIFFLPRLSELKKDELVRREIKKAFQFLLPVLLIITLFIFSFRLLIIKILFSNDFLSMESLFLFQLIGDFFKISSLILSINLLAKVMTKVFIVLEVSFSSFYILISYYFISKYGITGATYAYSLNNVMYFIAMIWIFRKMLFTNVVNN